MRISERIDAFAELGDILRSAVDGNENRKSAGLNDLINKQYITNPWFTPDNVSAAIRSIACELTEEKLTRWTSAYPQLQKDSKPLTAGIIMAGNIPLAGFHDFLTVLISGNRVKAKTSSKDPELIVKISEILSSVNPEFSEMIEFAEGLLKDFDIVIATGSNNSSRYFEYYFGRYPGIIRKNRNSIAVIDGNETGEELKCLGSDIFRYFGLGCRSVSKIYIPDGFDVKAIIPSWQPYSGLTTHGKYANNYDFYKAVYLVNKEKFLDTGYLLLREENGLSSPVAVLYFEFYQSPESLNEEILGLKDKIQCVVGHSYVPFGEAQSPHLWDYADEIDTLDFILKIK